MKSMPWSSCKNIFLLQFIYNYIQGLFFAFDNNSCQCNKQLYADIFTKRKHVLICKKTYFYCNSFTISIKVSSMLLTIILWQHNQMVILLPIYSLQRELSSRCTLITCIIGEKKKLELVILVEEVHPLRYWWKYSYNNSLFYQAFSTWCFNVA